MKVSAGRISSSRIRTYAPKQPLRGSRERRIHFRACADARDRGFNVFSEVWGFGRGMEGQLGPSVNWSTVPMRLPVPAPVVAAACGRTFSLFIRADGRLYACGSNHGCLFSLRRYGGCKVQRAKSPHFRRKAENTFERDAIFCAQ